MVKGERKRKREKGGRGKGRGERDIRERDLFWFASDEVKNTENRSG